MKLFAILVLALVAQSYATSHHQQSWDDNQQNSRYLQRNSQSSSEENSQNWGQQNWDHELEDILDESLASSSSSSATAHTFQSRASQLPQAESYKNKITQRLNGSNSLAAKPELKRKLFKMADQKLEACKTPSGEALDKHCVGRTVGQMMQLIASVETANRQPIAYNNHRSSDY